MKKQENPSPEINEQFFMNMIAGTAPVVNEPKSNVIPAQEPDNPKEKMKEPAKPTQSRTDYEELFLKRNELTNRRSTFISVTNHEKLTQLVQCIGGGNLSVGGFIDTLLTHHFEEYKTEISQLFDTKFSKLF